LRQVDPAGHDVFHDVYRQRAERDSGNLDRNRAIWERVTSPRDGEKAIYAYVVGDESHPEGYVVFSQPEREGHYDLFIRDLVALTPGAIRRLLTFFADHSSMARELIWCGPLADPVACLLPEQDHRLKHWERWMMRVVDVRQALAMRGYPDGMEAELHFELADDLLPENQGRIVLHVSQGRGEVTGGGRGELKLEVSRLAPLYSGFLSPQQLAAIGFLSGPPAALATAARLFAGPEPWMPDFF
jgi:predicted acetyltransferase